MAKTPQTETVQLDDIVGGGQTIATLSDGRKVFVWGGLPGERVTIRLTKSKARFAEGIVTDVISPSKHRIAPQDPESYMSTSPWQIMDFETEQHYKAALVEEAFELHGIALPGAITIATDSQALEYRNKAEFSWYGDATASGETLDLAFHVRGTKGKVPVTKCALVNPAIMQTATDLRDALHTLGVVAKQLKTVIIRCDQRGNTVWQLYVKDTAFPTLAPADIAAVKAAGGEVIYSDPKSPASKITKRLQSFGNTVLCDTVLGVPFHYAAEGFFQVNLPAYEQSLKDMRQWVPPDARVLDLYSGVGSIGLTIGGAAPELVEINPDAVREMKRNITELNSKATAILAASEQALGYITADKTVIVDPPRAGLHSDVIKQLIAATPARIIYLSCNPVTQARDIVLLSSKYRIVYHRGYNFFPRTPHIEHLVILDIVGVDA